MAAFFSLFCLKLGLLLSQDSVGIASVSEKPTLFLITPICRPRVGGDPVVEPPTLGPRLRGDDKGWQILDIQAILNFELVPQGTEAKEPTHFLTPLFVVPALRGEDNGGGKSWVSKPF